MPSCEDWLGNPLSIINNLYESDPVNFEEKVTEYFESKFANEKNYNLIPCLNELSSLNDLHASSNCLVRFRCMIQDTFDPIYYNMVQSIKHKETNEVKQITLKYKEVIDHGDSYEAFECEELLESGVWRTNVTSLGNQRLADKDILRERQTLYCTPIPGESQWIRNQWSKSNPRYQQQQQNLQSGPINDLACLVKIYDNFDGYKLNDVVEFVGILYKDESLAYMHDEHNDQFQQNQIQQQNEPAKPAEGQVPSDQTPMDVDESGRPKVLSSYMPSKVPRLHCIKSSKLLHLNPHLRTYESELNQYLNDGMMTDSTESSAEKSDKASQKAHFEARRRYWERELKVFKETLSTTTNLNERAQVNPLNKEKSVIFELRQELINFFQELLLGDALAAEYLLMNLVSSVFLRQDVTVLGKFTLNLYNLIDSRNEQVCVPKKKYTECLFKYLQEFLTSCQKMQISVEYLNNANLIPSKDYNKNKLVHGALQLPINSHLIIDETSLNTGELKTKGLMNVNALNDIIKWQKMNYDFGFHSHEFNTNIRVLVLSQTKSILAHDCQIKLRPTVTEFDADAYERHIDELLNFKYADLMVHFRNYLTIMTHLDYKLNDSIQKTIQDDIVHIKQHSLGKHLNQKPENEKFENPMGIDDFHNLLVIARLQTLTYGKTELSLYEWNKSKTLEFERINNRV